MKLKVQPPAQDAVEKDFLDALKRLQDGTPKNKALKLKKAQGILKITAQNVALEAGRSRTLISLEQCRFPRVRELLRQIKTGETSLPTTHSELIQRLRVDKAELSAQVTKYRAEATAHFLFRVDAEKEAERDRSAMARIRKQLSGKGNVTHLVKPDQD